MYEKYIKQLETGTGGGEAVKASIEAMKKVDHIMEWIESKVTNDSKPEWHDLRKDPFDLPEEDGAYMIAYSTKNDDAINVFADNYYTDEFGNGHVGFAFDHDYSGNHKVIAWKELEKFMEE